VNESGAQQAPVLMVRDASVSYVAPIQALHNVSFEVHPGELVAVVGPNGAGKSTLFKAISGLVAHTGTVALCGVHCHHQRDRLGAAYIPQRSDLDFDFPITVGQLVLAGRRRFLRLGQRSGPKHRAAALGALDRVGLADLHRRPLATLSGGQAQRAFLARALAQEAHLILLDEALSGVDQPRTEALLDLFADLTASDVSLLVATHDLSLARRRFGRCLAINVELIADGPSGIALGPEAIEATFGTPRAHAGGAQGARR
jgi:ABC-type Mn2+/Zn2+ transport system ATPase subunit